MTRIDVQGILGSKNVLKIKNKLFMRNNPEYKELLLRNREFKGKHNGERCFILGNGPSLSKVDLTLLKDEVTFSVNQLPRNPQFSELHTTYHMWMDNRFFDISEDHPETMELLDVMKQVNTLDNHPIVFYNIDAYEMIRKYRLDNELNIRYIAHTYIKDIEGLTSSFLDVSTVLPSFSTVVHYLICLAIYMGFKDIILLGCDCTSIISITESRLGNAEKSPYGYKISENEKKRLEAIQSLTSIRDEMMWQVELFDCYSYLDQYCRKQGARLRNATYPTLLECIEKVSMDDVLKA